MRSILVAIFLGFGSISVLAQPAVPRGLSLWRFNGPDWLAGDQGQYPVVSNKVSAVPSFDGTALRLQEPGSRLMLGELRPDGSPNFELVTGSARFWFKPDWALTNAPDGARLLEVGVPRETYGSNRPGAWSLHVRVYDGAPYLCLQFETSSGPDESNTGGYLLRQPLPATWATPRWHQITLSTAALTNYDTTFMYCDGALMSQTKGGYSYFGGPGLSPSQAIARSTRSRGIALASRTNGLDNWWAHGSIDQVEFFNYPLGLLDRGRHRTLTSASVAANPPSITLLRPDDPSPDDAHEFLKLQPVSIYRRTAGDTNWGTPSVNRSTAVSWTDATVATNTLYEYAQTYRLEAGSYRGTNHLLAGIDVAPVLRSGQVILLVDETLARPLSSEISQLKASLVADGWKVKSFNVPRHDDSKWANNPRNIALIASTIAGAYDPSTTNTVYILGHVAIPYSGMMAVDGHDTHRGAWVCDGYYGCLDKSYFTDTRTADSRLEWAAANDGRFDQHSLPANREMAVGRVDFARMPAFIRAPFLPRQANSEAAVELELLRQYLKKAQAWRRNERPLPPRVCAMDRIGQEMALAGQAGAASAPNFGLSPGTLLESRSIQQRVPCTFGVYFGYGGAQEMHVAVNRTNQQAIILRTADLAAPSAHPSVYFQVLWGSYFPDWNLTENNFLRAMLATPDFGLWAVSRWGWRFERTAMGAPVGAAMFGEDLASFQSILGDPTLRLHRASPVGRLSASKKNGTVRLTWTHPEPNAVFYVYRSTNGPDGFGEPMPGMPTTEMSFADSAAPSGTTYMVRPSVKLLTQSGTFHALGCGEFAKP